MGISYDPPSRKWNVVPESIPDTTPKQTSIWVDDNGGNLYAIDVSKDAYWVQQHNKSALELRRQDQISLKFLFLLI
jgi:hypothetical protein